MTPSKGEGKVFFEQPMFLTNTIVLSDQGRSAYADPATELEQASIGFEKALELPGWGGRLGPAAARRRSSRRLNRRSCGVGPFWTTACSVRTARDELRQRRRAVCGQRVRQPPSEGLLFGETIVAWGAPASFSRSCGTSRNRPSQTERVTSSIFGALHWP